MGPVSSRALSAFSYLLYATPLSLPGRVALFAARAFSIGTLLCLAFPKVRNYVWSCIKGPKPPNHPPVHPSLPLPPRLQPPTAQPKAVPPEAFRVKTDIIKQDLKVIRAPLTDYLSQHITLNDQGYHSEGIEKLKQHLNDNPSEFDNLGKFFGEVARQGDAGYAHDIRTMLARHDIISKQVSKLDGSPVITNPRPHSQGIEENWSMTEPPHYRNVAAYIDSWGFQIWSNYRLYRREIFQFATNKKAGQDYQLTGAQIDHYEVSFARIQKLHSEGYILGRVAVPEEPKETAGHRPNMENDILSTTLWPKEGSLVQIKLFCEWGNQETVGLLLDPERVSQKDFSVAIPQNGGTAGLGYLNLKKIYQKQAAVCLEAQHGLLQAFESAAQTGGKPSDVLFTLSPDRTGWVIEKTDARNTQISQRSGHQLSSLEVLWNEMTYYRGVSGDLLIGLFVKSDSESFSQELKRLFELQDHVRRTKGRFLPIFKFDGEKNRLTEIPPDALLLSILGLNTIPPIDRKSTLSNALTEAGITEESAISMSQSLPPQGTIKSLFDLQLLMFNLKDITGCVSILEGQSYAKIRLIDNLHLVFPTIHKTQNKTARQPDLFFAGDDVKKIKEKRALQSYLASAIKYNLKRFLGITVYENSDVLFNETTLSLFDVKDRKKLDFAKVIARAMQAAVLFNIFGDNTKEMVKQIVGVIRTELPYLGLTPTGDDMILGSFEMRAIAQDALTDKLAKPAPQASTPKPQFENKLDFSNILDLHQTLPLAKSKASEFLAPFGINQDGTIDQEKLKGVLINDPSFIQSEAEVLKALEFLSLENPQLALTITKNLRLEITCFGFSADGKDLFSKENQSILVQWIQARKTGSIPPTEFPFEAISSSGPSQTLPVVGRSRGRFDPQQQENYTPVRGGPGSYIPTAPAAAAQVSPETLLADLAKGITLKERFINLVNFSGKKDSRFSTFKTLGLVNQKDEPLWTITPTFHDVDQNKPTAPYLAITDMLGKHAVQLVTGPAMNPDILKADQETVKVYFDSTIIPESEVQRFITHTLAVTTDGDHQVVRPNGTQYCRAVTPPMGGNIEFNAGNEMYDFRRMGDRRFFANDTKKRYTGMGGYSKEELKKVQTYDALLLSDEERRLKCEGVVMAGTITITAKGGYGSLRIPLDKAHRVLFIDTCGAQFEKYGDGNFNELEASDFIIKKGAAANNTPLFSQNENIPAHAEITVFGKLGDKEWSKEYVQMADEAFFNRQAFKKSIYRKLSSKVLPIIQDNVQQPFYLKATLFGGGFFAKTKNAGDLREEVVHAMISGYVKLIQENRFPEGSVIEFPRYGKLDDLEPSLKQALLDARKKNVEIAWSEEGDLCDFNTQTSLSGISLNLCDFEDKKAMVLLNAGDAMSWKGNESSSASVEAMIANNSNLRLVFNWWANPLLLEPEGYKKLS